MAKMITRAEARSVFLYDSCVSCPLGKQHKLRTPKMKPTGSDRPEVYVLGDAPGVDDDARGEQFAGKSGRMLRPLLKGIETRWNGAVRCRTPKGRAPTNNEMACCRKSVIDDIERSKPRLVMLVGDSALRYVTGDLDGIKRWRGRFIPARFGNHVCWAAPILHPEWVSRAINMRDRDKIGREWEDVYKMDVRRVREWLKKGATTPRVYEQSELQQSVRIMKTDADAVVRFLKSCRGKQIALDYETNAIRPYRMDASKEPKVLTIAISTGKSTVAFPFRHRESPWGRSHLKVIQKAFVECIMNAKRVIAHNAVFEMEWTASLAGADALWMVPWQCTMQQAYIIDERPAGTGLDFCCLERLGIRIKLASKVDRANLDAERLDDVLAYNALDAIAAMILYRAQKRAIDDEGLHGIYAEHIKRLPAVAHAQRSGIPVNEEVVRAFDARYKAETKTIERQISELPEVRRFAKRVGRVFKPSSPDHVQILLRDHLKCREGNTKDGKYKTDKGVLENIKHPVAKLLLAHRDVVKLHGTYVANMLPGQGLVYDDGRIHMSYKTAYTGTGRLSCEDPNMQNWPVRKHPEIRGQIVAPDGYVIAAFDYGQIEARLIGAASEDPFLMRSLFEDYDIHMEWAKRIAEAYPPAMKPFFKKGLEEAKCWKAMRGDVKSGWVFAGFYGSKEESMARRYNLPSHISRKLYKQFWDQFAGVKSWQDDLIDFYMKHGYVETLTGRRRHAPLTQNMIFNSGTQGSASDLVVHAGNELGRMAYESDREWMHWVMNIHDDLTYFIPDDDDLDNNIKTVADVMLNPGFDWVTVPLLVEVKVGYDWSDMTAVCEFRRDPNTKETA